MLLAHELGQSLGQCGLARSADAVPEGPEPILRIVALRTTTQVPCEKLTDFTGVGFDLQHQDFFTPGCEFRIPSFWTTTPSLKIADFFLTRAFQAGFPPVRWIIKVDEKLLCWACQIHAQKFGARPEHREAT